MDGIGKIETASGIYEYKIKHLKIGNKKINKQISKENLLLFNKIMKKNNVSFMLAYGTLLGAIREKDFIEHDEDTDVIILDEIRQTFINTLFELRDYGFEVFRYKKDLLSIERKGEYIDIYIFRKAKFGKRVMDIYVTKEKFLLQTIDHEFLGEVFKIPKDYAEYLVFYYGTNWKTPIKNSHAKNIKLSAKIKRNIKKKFSFKRKA